jgi:hypothetical protein
MVLSLLLFAEHKIECTTTGSTETLATRSCFFGEKLMDIVYHCAGWYLFHRTLTNRVMQFETVQNYGKGRSLKWLPKITFCICAISTLLFAIKLRER